MVIQVNNTLLFLLFNCPNVFFCYYKYCWLQNPFLKSHARLILYIEKALIGPKCFYQTVLLICSNQASTLKRLNCDNKLQTEENMYLERANEANQNNNNKQQTRYGIYSVTDLRQIIKIYAPLLMINT